MSNSPYVRSAIAQAALEIVPPLIRKTLLEQPEFREEYGFWADAVIVFGDSNASFRRSDLFNSIREILSGAAELKVTDIDGQEWQLRNQGEDGKLPKLAIISDERTIPLPDFTVLSPDVASRLHLLAEATSDVNLPTDAQDCWHSILSVRSLEDEEVDRFCRDFLETPVQVERLIRRKIAFGQISVSSLVPSSRRYFERLVGAYDGSTSIRDYAAGTGREFFQKLSAWRPDEGFSFSMLLSCHSAMTAEIGVEYLSGEDLVCAFDFLEKHGDRLSQLGAIEIGLRILPERPEIEPFVIRLIEQIRDDDVEGLASGFQLLSALFLLVDGELSRTRLLSGKPPFYRRLASLSHAALIHRQLVNSGVESDAFCEWALKNRGEQFYLQSLADMRLEPRWNSDLATASHMKAEFFGRIMIAAANYDKNIKGSKLHNLILDEESGSLQSLCEFPRPFLPGPLEGVENTPNILPGDLSEAIKAQLNADEVGPASFIALVNSALIFRIDSDQAELAAKVLKLGNYRLMNVEDKSQLLVILHGLATTAAVARNRTLADELQILVRRYRRDAQYSLSIDEVLWICLIAAASRADLNDWREFVGEFLIELAFGELEGDEGNTLHSHLQCLCHAVPELWVYCSKADAALKALIAR